MENTISAQEIKRRGISAVDEALRRGPVHVIRGNRPRYVILDEKAYLRLLGRQEAVQGLWDRLLAEGPVGSRTVDEIRRQLEAEGGSWERP